MKINQVELNADSMEADKLYLWRWPCGEIKTVWLSDCKNGLIEWDDFWDFEHGLVGELFGPIELVNQQ